MDILYKTFYSQIFHFCNILWYPLHAGEYDTFHVQLWSTIFGKKLNRVPCLHWVGVPCSYRHVEYYSMSDSPIFVKGRTFTGQNFCPVIITCRILFFHQFHFLHGRLQDIIYVWLGWHINKLILHDKWLSLRSR